LLAQEGGGVSPRRIEGKKIMSRIQEDQIVEAEVTAQGMTKGQMFVVNEVITKEGVHGKFFEHILINLQSGDKIKIINATFVVKVVK
jgi:hypothetical protein